MLRKSAATRHFRSGDKTRDGHESRGTAASVNIIGNLAAKNLYTLTFAENTANQYNLESWFNRHESSYEETYSHLRTPLGDRLKTDEADTVKVPEALWRIPQLKSLDILRDPHNHKNPFAHRLCETARARPPEVGSKFVCLISKRDLNRTGAVMQNYRFSFLGYVDWLVGLYGMLSEGVAQSPLFGRLFYTIFVELNVVKTELLRYAENEGLYLFGDSSFCLQTSPKLISVGVNISHSMSAVVRLQTDRWLTSENAFHHDTPELRDRVRTTDSDQIQ